MPALLLTLALGAAPAARAAGGDSAGVAIGATVADFTLPDLGGRQQSLALLKGAKGTVLIFISVQCPVSNAYNERMEKLAQEYRARGVNVVGINANATEPVEAIREHAAQHKLTFPILKDKRNVIADRLGALVTPEVYFLDAANKLVYRGPIDNSRNGDAVTTSYLREALDATLAGRPVARSEARAFGCSIKRAGRG